jgi:hypothetical protein
MQDNLQINLQTADTAKTIVPAPVELTAEQLQQVGGGLVAPSSTQGPAGTW